MQVVLFRRRVVRGMRLGRAGGLSAEGRAEGSLDREASSFLEPLQPRRRQGVAFSRSRSTHALQSGRILLNERPCYVAVRTANGLCFVLREWRDQTTRHAAMGAARLERSMLQ